MARPQKDHASNADDGARPARTMQMNSHAETAAKVGKSRNSKTEKDKKKPSRSSKRQGSDSDSSSSDDSSSDESQESLPPAENGDSEVKSAVKTKTTTTTKKEEKQKKKKEKDGTLRQEPAWLFPPDADNPVLQPKSKSKAVEEKETQDRLQAIDYLKHHAVGAPHKPGPPKLLLQLIGSFLDSYGFNSTGRVFTAEREARKKMIGWDDSVGTEPLDAKLPSLIQIYKQWLATRDTLHGTSASEKAFDVHSNRASNGIQPTTQLSATMDATSSEGEDSDSDSSSKDSDDHSQGVRKPSNVVAPRTSTNGTNGAPTVNALVNKLKHKSPKHGTATRESSSSSSSDSDSGSDADSDSASSDATPRKTKVTQPTSITQGLVKEGTVELHDSRSGVDSESASSTSTSSSGSSNKKEKVNGHLGASEDAMTTSDLAKRKRTASPQEPGKESKAKFSKKSGTPFQRIPSDTKINPKLASNAYQSYDYADRAFKDLSVTRGKGFTKEKNKKKRGS